jgi:succinyl-CoA synthetase alpha subunit
MPQHIFKPGRVGVVSRSGTLTYEIAASMTQERLGQSTCIGIGGDPIVGLGFIDILKLFEKDPQTDAVALIGEIGGDMEELAADFIAKTDYSKPVVAYIAGLYAPPEKRMGHAGAIVTEHTGDARSKIAAFESVGVEVAKRPSEVAHLLKSALRE